MKICDFTEIYKGYSVLEKNTSLLFFFSAHGIDEVNRFHDMLSFCSLSCGCVGTGVDLVLYSFEVRSCSQWLDRKEAGTFGRELLSKVQPTGNKSNLLGSEKNQKKFAKKMLEA